MENKVKFNPETVKFSLNWFHDLPSLRGPMVNLVSANQQMPPHEQILTLAMTFTCLAEAIGMDPHEVVAGIQRQKDVIDAPFASQWKAMTEYAKGELLG